MPASGFFIDSNLLMLLIVSGKDRYLISKRRRLQDFSEKDDEILLNLVERFDKIYVTPNTLTETSNLLGQHKEPERSQFLKRLRTVIEESEEIVVTSVDASNNEAFERLGLTDAALLEPVMTETPRITVDFDLYHAALMKKGEDAAINFTHYRFAD